MAVLVVAALTKLEAVNPTAAQLVKLRHFAGLSQLQAEEALGPSSIKQASYGLTPERGCSQG